MGRKLTPLVLALAVVLGACAGNPPDPLALVSAAPVATTEAGTARMHLETIIRLGTAGDVRTTGEGVVDFERQRGNLTLQLPSAGQASLGELELVYDGTVIYYRASSLFPDAPTPWVSIDIARLSESVTGTDFEQLDQGATNDPSNTLALLKGVADEIEEVGTEEVRGEDTTHYRATVDVRRALEQQGAVEDRQRFEMFLDQFGTETIPVEVWLDEEGRARRVRYDQPLPETPGVSVPAGTGVSLTIELYDFGVEAPVEIPPPAEVTDLTELSSGAAEGPGGVGTGTTSTTSTTI